MGALLNLTSGSLKKATLPRGSISPRVPLTHPNSYEGLRAAGFFFRVQGLGSSRDELLHWLFSFTGAVTRLDRSFATC